MYFVARMDLSCALWLTFDLMPTIQYLKFKNCHFMFHLSAKKWLFYKCTNDMFHINFNIFAKSRLLIFLFGTLSDADSKQGSVLTSRLLGKQLTTLNDKKKKWKIYCLWPFVLGQQTDDSNQVGRNRWDSRPATLMDRHLQNICNLCWSKPQFFRWWYNWCILFLNLLI